MPLMHDDYRPGWNGYVTVQDVEERLLRELGSRKRELGESEQPEAERKLMRRLETVQMERKQIPNPGADPRLMDAATILVECAYVDGDFGEGERDEEWLRAEANDLAGSLQGAYEDWHATREAGGL